MPLHLAVVTALEPIGCRRLRRQPNEKGGQSLAAKRKGGKPALVRGRGSISYRAESRRHQPSTTMPALLNRRFDRRHAGLASPLVTVTQPLARIFRSLGRVRVILSRLSNDASVMPVG
jgi:hypothetical protein